MKSRFRVTLMWFIIYLFSLWKEFQGSPHVCVRIHQLISGEQQECEATVETWIAKPVKEPKYYWRKPFFGVVRIN